MNGGYRNKKLIIKDHHKHLVKNKHHFILIYAQVYKNNFGAFSRAGLVKKNADAS